MSARTFRTLAVTGTDTNIGKTVVTTALAARADVLGIRVAAMKPIESGTSRLTRESAVLLSDAERLRRATGSTDPMSLVCPITLDEPLAPMVAAERAGLMIDLSVLDRARESLMVDRDLLLVEGAGGLLAPITRDVSFAQLFVRWHSELLIVAGNRIGVLNHVLLTVQVATSLGLPIRALVLTDLSDRDPSIAQATNYDALVQLLPRQRIHRFPWVDRIDDTAALAAAAAGAGLDSVLLQPAVP